MVLVVGRGVYVFLRAIRFEEFQKIIALVPFLQEAWEVPEYWNFSVTFRGFRAKKRDAKLILLESEKIDEFSGSTCCLNGPRVGHITCIFATYLTTSPRLGLDELKPGMSKTLQ